ncbi:DUF6883 domain-containing protein [Methylophilus sp. TWE2]|uniref:DUF6883 domain-containing protein n=1 Tax=Methylophilus sp. TWE2 TaxID=1662285 RepID=UPI000AC16534|nr:DUF6883 domain-containing protein [Methylophilus sp. TWE2]
MEETTGPFAFFFDSKHHDCDEHFYGPPCTSKIMDALAECGSEISTQITRGDLLLHYFAYQISAVRSERTGKNDLLTVGHTLTANQELYRLLLCDFTDSLKAYWHTVNTVNFMFQLPKNHIWTIVLPTVPLSVAQRIDQKVKSFGPYLGASYVDMGNPLHSKVFQFPAGLYFQNGKFYSDSEEITSLYSHSVETVIIDESNYYELEMPRLLQPLELSERGKLSLERMQGRNFETHAIKLAKALMEYLNKNSNPDAISFNAASGHSNFEPVCDERKIRDYLLNPDHIEGGPKAKFFTETLGITRDDWRYLTDQIINAVKTVPAFTVRKSPHGISHSAVIEIIGRNNRTALIKTAWIVRENEPPRFVTAIPFSEDLDFEFQVPAQNISPVGLHGDELYEDIYKRANTAGLKAAENCVPIPMVIEGYGPVFGGECGDAWVTIPNDEAGMKAWLKSNNIGTKDYKLGWRVDGNLEQFQPSKGEFWTLQAIAPKEAYARAFCKVLNDNNIKCNVFTLLD